MNSCDLNLMKCLNNGKCLVNIELNTTYCQCDLCYKGIRCEVSEGTYINETYVYMIVYFIGVCLSILNNGLVLELIIRSRRIRNTNIGIYLMVYCILSFLSIILLAVYESVTYYTNRFDPEKVYLIFRCFLAKIGFNSLNIFCIFLNACIAFERGLIICFDVKMHASRWRSCATIIVLLLISGASVTPMLVYECRWHMNPSLQFARHFLSWFYIAAGILVYVLATLLVLISFTRRIRRYGMEKGSYLKTFFKLLFTHLFIFIPPVAYGISKIPYTVYYYTYGLTEVKKICVTSIGRYITEVLLEVFTGIPFIVTWLLFVYPSRVYMTEFYLNTWSGQRLANLLLLFKSFNNRNKINHLSTTNLINDEQPKPENQNFWASDVRTYDEVSTRFEEVQRSTQKYTTITYDKTFRRV